MTIVPSRRAAALLLLCLALAGCGLPRSGPSRDEVFEGSVRKSGDTFVVAVDDRIARVTSGSPDFGFGPAFREARPLGADTIRPGDRLGLTIYENVDNGLFTSEVSNRSAIREVQVGDDGAIFVPYAGRIRAAGNSPDALRRIITRKLDKQTPDPQVLVTRVAGTGASVSVSGAVGAQGVYPITRATRRLVSMLAKAGGPAVEPEIAQVTLIRHGHRGRIWYTDLFDTPGADIALRDGDRILVEGDPRTYTALGATGRQARVPFQSRTISAMQAVAQAGGLRTTSADPTGIFVLRDEPASTARAVLGQRGIDAPQRFAYVLDLTAPNGLFRARDFAIRDGDTVYVTEAPFVRWQKRISALTGTAGSARTLSSVAPE